MIWWEKHVEYKFVRDSEFDFAMPLAGQPEAALSDTIFGSNDKAVLIEFKREKSSLQLEKNKFFEGSLDKAAEAVAEYKRCHYLVYGELCGDEFVLKGREYFADTQVSTGDILRHGVSIEDFKKYCELLMPHRCPDKRCTEVFEFSGLEQVIGISEKEVKVVTFKQFLDRCCPNLSPVDTPAPRGPKFG